MPRNKRKKKTVPSFKNRQHTVTWWWPKLHNFIEKLFGEENIDTSETPSLLNRFEYVNQSNAQYIEEEQMNKTPEAELAEQEISLQKEIDDRYFESIISQFETPSCCSYLFFPIVYIYKKIFCSYRLKCSLKKKDSWQSKMSTGLDAGVLLRENMLGILSGILIGFLSFIVYIFAFPKAPHIATLSSCYTMLFAVFGIAFNEDVRCVAMLVIPYLVASKTRWLLMLYATCLTTMGPGLNFMHNSGNFRNAIGCVLGQVSTNLKLLEKITSAPVSLIKNQIQSFINGINSKLEKIRKMLSTIKNSFIQVNKVMDSKNSWIKSMIESCGDETAMKNQCLSFFNTLYFNCVASVKAVAFICNIVRVFASEACNIVEGLSTICEQEANKLHTHVTDASLVTDSQIEDSEAAILQLIGRKNVSMDSEKLIDLDLSAEVSSQANVIELIERRMDSMLDGVKIFKRYLNWLMIGWTLFTVLQLVIQAALFRRNWLLKIYFQNEYITSSFIYQERQAFIKKQITTLPFSLGERWRYVTFKDWWWSSSERKSAFSSFLFLSIAIMFLIGIIIADYAMYHILITTAPAFSSGFGKTIISDVVDGIPELGHTVGEESVPNIEGNSSFANMGRSFLSLANPLKDIAFDVDVSLCRPKASPPDMMTNLFVGLTIACTIFSIITQVYIMRLRHVILIWYYPQRDNERAAWLRTYIRNSRGLFYRLVHQFKTKDNKPKHGKTRLPFLERILFVNPILSNYLAMFGLHREYCVFCGDVGNPKKILEFKQKFTQCPQCGNYLCASCQVDFKGICLICNIPLNVLSIDVDFEQLSSDEDNDYFFGKYLKRQVHDNFKLSIEAVVVEQKDEKPVEEKIEEGEIDGVYRNETDGVEIDVKLQPQINKLTKNEKVQVKKKQSL